MQTSIFRRVSKWFTFLTVGILIYRQYTLEKQFGELPVSQSVDGEAMTDERPRTTRISSGSWGLDNSYVEAAFASFGSMPFIRLESIGPQSDGPGWIDSWFLTEKRGPIDSSAQYVTVRTAGYFYVGYHLNFGKPATPGGCLMIRNKRQACFDITTSQFRTSGGTALYLDAYDTIGFYVDNGILLSDGHVNALFVFQIA